MGTIFPVQRDGRDWKLFATLRHRSRAFALLRPFCGRHHYYYREHLVKNIHRLMGYDFEFMIDAAKLKQGELSHDRK
jgi:hypothetical protein